MKQWQLAPHILWKQFLHYDKDTLWSIFPINKSDKQNLENYVSCIPSLLQEDFKFVKQAYFLRHGSISWWEGMFADIRQEHKWGLESRRFASDKESLGMWGGMNLWSQFLLFCLFSLLARIDNSNPNIILGLSSNSKLLNKQEKNPKTWQNIVGSKVALETQMQPNQCRNFRSLAGVVESSTLTWFVCRGAQEVEMHSADYKVTIWST